MKNLNSLLMAVLLPLLVVFAPTACSIAPAGYRLYCDSSGRCPNPVHS